MSALPPTTPRPTSHKYYRLQLTHLHVLCSFILVWFSLGSYLQQPPPPKHTHTHTHTHAPSLTSQLSPRSTLNAVLVVVRPLSGSRHRVMDDWGGEERERGREGRRWVWRAGGGARRGV